MLLVTGKVGKSLVPMLTSWIKAKSIAVLCGNFGKNDKATCFVRELAQAAGAVGCGPCHQVVKVFEPRRSRGFKVCTHPSYMMMFGYFRQMQWREFPDELDKSFELGRDILDEMINYREPRNRSRGT